MQKMVYGEGGEGGREEKRRGVGRETGGEGKGRRAVGVLGTGTGGTWNRAADWLRPALNVHYNLLIESGTYPGLGRVVSFRFQIPLHGPTDFVCKPTGPTDKIRTCRDCS